jgi:hypothetical protein
MSDTSTVIRSCKNHGFFHNFCSSLIEALEYQTRNLLVVRHAFELSKDAILNVSCKFRSS